MKYRIFLFLPKTYSENSSTDIGENFLVYVKDKIDRKLNTDCELTIRRVPEKEENHSFLEQYFPDSKYIIIVIYKIEKDFNNFEKWLSSLENIKTLWKTRLSFILLETVKITPSLKEYPFINISLNYKSCNNDGAWENLFSILKEPILNFQITLLEPDPSSNNFEIYIYDFLVYLKDKIDRNFNIDCKCNTLPLLKDDKTYENIVEKYFQECLYVIIIVCEESNEVNDFCSWLSSFIKVNNNSKSRLLLISLGAVKINLSLKEYPFVNISSKYKSKENDRAWKNLFNIISNEKKTIQTNLSNIISNESKKRLSSENSSNSNKKKEGPSGLRNSKETCYMNSMIQALASSEKLINKMSSLPQNDKLDMLINCLNGINKKKDIKENTALLQILMNSVEWDRAHQEDAFQLLSFSITSIQKCKMYKKETFTEMRNMPPKFKIVHTFSENIKYNKVQDHLALALPLCGNYKELPGVLLESLMDEFFAPSMIDDGPYNTQLYLFKEAPEVMIIHIQANEWNHDLGTYVKPKYYIKYQEQLKYTFKIQNKVDGSEMVSSEVTYQLMAVVHHMGSISGGHYITYRRHGQTWYLTNDTQVKKISFKCDIVPYIMVYEKRGEEEISKVEEENI